MHVHSHTWGVGGGGEGKRERGIGSSNQADKGASDNPQSLCELYSRVFLLELFIMFLRWEHFACV